MSLNVAELQPVLHDLFHDTADQLARDTGFCQRQRLLTGSVFAQTLVFALLAKPDATLEEFADFAARHHGVVVTPNAFQERFNPAAVDFFRELLQAAFDCSFQSLRPALLPVLRHFTGVYLRDASLLHWPEGLAHLFPTRPAGAATPQAGVKLVLEMEVTTGAFTELDLQPAWTNDKVSPIASPPLPEGSLLLEDMGFLGGERLQTSIEQGVYVLTRVPHWTAFFVRHPRGRGLVRWNVRKALHHLAGSCREWEVFLFHKQKIAVRLLAARVPEAIAHQRRVQVRADAKRRGRPVSQAKLDLCEWTLLVTNAPASLLTAFNAWEVRRVRWQIELVFKVFKSDGGLERTAARTPCRVFAELYAKLLALVVQPWCLLSAGYVMLRQSLRRASRRVRPRADQLLERLGDLLAWTWQIVGLGRELGRCAIDHRPQKPSTFDRLAALDYEFRQRDLTG